MQPEQKYIYSKKFSNLTEFRRVLQWS